jgi:hypothetical protein
MPEYQPHQCDLHNDIRMISHDRKPPRPGGEQPAAMDRGTWWWWLALAAGSAALAWLFEQAALPAALLLGPMIAAIICGCLGAPVRVPRMFFGGAQTAIGCLVASTITPPIVASIAQAWLPMLLVVTTTIAAGALVGWALTRFGALPGPRPRGVHRPAAPRRWSRCRRPTVPICASWPSCSTSA